MKRILFVFIIASITVNAFAIDFSAQIIGTINLIKGDSDDITPNHDNVIMGGSEAGRIRLEANMEKEKFGAWARLNADSEDKGIISAAGFLFYKPNNILDFYITRKPANNGHWALDGNALWGFYGMVREVIVVDYHSYEGSLTALIPRFDNAFYSGFTDGAFLSIYTPLKGLGLNLGLPVFEHKTAENMFKSITFQISYDITDFGLLGFTFEGEETETKEEKYSPSLYFYFNLKKLQKVNLDFGVGYKLPGEDLLSNVKIDYPVSFGVTAFVDNDKIDFKGRLLVSAFGKTGNAEGPVDIVADILPSMSFTGNITGYFNAGIQFRILKSVDPVALWHLNPYVVFGNMTTAAFYAGFRIDNRGGNNGFLYWAVPLGISANF